MTLKIGSKAPAFSATDQDGHVVRLKDLKGQKIVLYFYPRDQTPGCTAEACNLRDHYKQLKKAGFEVFGVSSDTESAHQKFISKENLPFRLLADVDKSIHQKYGTWVEKSMYGRKYMGTARVTFLIDEQGVIFDIIEKVDTKNHADQILGINQEKKAIGTPKAAKKTASKKKPVKKNKAKK